MIEDFLINILGDFPSSQLDIMFYTMKFSFLIFMLKQIFGVLHNLVGFKRFTE